MGRPRLKVGTCGEIRTYKVESTRKDGTSYTRYRAMCYYRDYDGRTRPVQRYGPTATKARSNLREALAERSVVDANADITPESTIEHVGKKWLEGLRESVKAGSKSPETLRLLEGTWKRHVKPAVAELAVRELTTGKVDNLLQSIAKNKGASSAKASRTVLSGIIGLAARHDALEKRANPVREAGKIEHAKKDKPRSFEVAEMLDLRAKIRGEILLDWTKPYKGGKTNRTLPEFAAAADLPGMIDHFMATGCRIGEVCAATWDAISFDEGWIEVRGTVIRIKGEGLVIKPVPKGSQGWVKLELPSWHVDGLRARRKAQMQAGKANPLGVVFTAPKGGLRDPSNTEADIRVVLDACGYEWARSHSFRRGVATAMDKAGLSARQAADQLRHAKVSMTQDVYFGREARATGAREVLEVLGGG